MYKLTRFEYDILTVYYIKFKYKILYLTLLILYTIIHSHLYHLYPLINNP